MYSQHGGKLQKPMEAPFSVIHYIAHNTSSDIHITSQNIIVDDNNEAKGSYEEVKFPWMGFGNDTSLSNNYSSLII